MNSIASFRQGKFSTPSLSGESYDNYNDPYAEELCDLLFNARKPHTSSGRNVRELDTHRTASQIILEFPETGSPRIKCPLSRSKWVDNILKHCDSRNEDAALKEIALITTRLKVKTEFSKLSTDLSSFELKKLPDIVLIALLRNTFSVRSQISCWDSLRDQIEQILENRKRNPRLLLRGLKSYS